MIIHCGEDNIKTFNDLLRQHFPSIRPILKQMIQVGLIKGIKGMSLEVYENGEKSPPKALPEIKAEPVKQRCKTCEHFSPSKVSGLSGVGSCLVITKLTLLWPNTEVCKHYIRGVEMKVRAHGD